MVSLDRASAKFYQGDNAGKISGFEIIDSNINATTRTVRMSFKRPFKAAMPADYQGGEIQVNKTMDVALTWGYQAGA